MSSIRGLLPSVQLSGCGRPFDLLGSARASAPQPSSIQQLVPLVTAGAQGGDRGQGRSGQRAHQQGRACPEPGQQWVGRHGARDQGEVGDEHQGGQDREEEEDPDGHQGRRQTSIAGSGGNLEVWVKPLGNLGTQAAVALFYLDYAGVGEGLGNFMAYGDLPLNDHADPNKPGDLFFPRGIILNRDLSKVLPLDPAQITEYVTHSWFSYKDESKGIHPGQGETTPNYTGPMPPYEFLNTDEKYSWLKAPRLNDQSMEVGPLARMLIAYVSGQERVKFWVDAVLKQLNAPATALFSTLGRTAARCVETLVLAEQLEPWTRELAANIGKGDLAIHENAHWDPSTWPAEAMGWGWSEAPRGALGHWVHIKDGKIANYQAIVPSTWNGSPRDAKGLPGAYEAALVGISVADPKQPLEILRTIHSFDPCMACAVHVLDANGVEITHVTVMD